MLIPRIRSRTDQRMDKPADLRGEGRRHGVTDLAGDLDFRPLELKPIGEGLKASGLPVSDRPMSVRDGGTVPSPV